MDNVNIYQGITLLHSFTEIPKSDWPELLRIRYDFCQKKLPSDCRKLLAFIEDARKADFAGFDSEESYIRSGLGLNPQAALWAVEGLKLSGEEIPQNYDEMVQKGKLLQHGGDRRSEKARDQGDNITLKDRGTSSAYTIARLDRDRPDLAMQVRQGSMSANAAAIEAGFRKPPPSPLESLFQAWRKADDYERRQFLKFLESENVKAS